MLITAGRAMLSTSRLRTRPTRTQVQAHRAVRHVCDLYARPLAASRDSGRRSCVFQATRLRVDRNISGVDFAVLPTTQIGGYVSCPSYGDGVEGRSGSGLPRRRHCLLSSRRAATSGYKRNLRHDLAAGVYRFVSIRRRSPYAAQWGERPPVRDGAGRTVGSERIQLEVELARLKP